MIASEHLLAKSSKAMHGKLHHSKRSSRVVGLNYNIYHSLVPATQHPRQAGRLLPVFVVACVRAAGRRRRRRRCYQFASPCLPALLVK